MTGVCEVGSVGRFLVDVSGGIAGALALMAARLVWDYIMGRSRLDRGLSIPKGGVRDPDALPEHGDR